LLAPTASGDEAHAFERDGYVGPVRVLDRRERRALGAYLRRSDVPETETWSKGRAARERVLYDLAVRPEILGRVTALLGEDVVLWGASAVRRRPHQVHPWHSDIESCAPEGGFISVWIGVENTSRDSALQLITRSHRLGTSLQEARGLAGIGRDDATPNELLGIVRAREPNADLLVPDLGDGDAIFFDGRLWHGTDNRRRWGERVALILQFARADAPVRIPDWDELDWPFRMLEEPRPPVVVVAGSASDGPNRVVPPPTDGAEPDVIRTALRAFELPLWRPLEEPWRPYPAFRGATPVCAHMSCHASVLAGGHSPHEPHAHEAEEILVPLHGEVELIVPVDASDARPRVERIGPGSFVYYPAWQHHTIRNPGDTPVAYLMLKWRAAPVGAGRPLGTEISQSAGVSLPAGEHGFWTHALLDGATGCLDRLHAHLSVVEPGAGYEPHHDAHDVAIVTLAGTVETLGRRVEPLSAVYYSAGELHGLRSVGPEPARYLVFEFHGPGVEPVTGRRARGPIVSRARRLARPLRRLARKLGS
jgi:mannose-6-phosphate isomerase-like protein (cupin superfamily)